MDTYIRWNTIIVVLFCCFVLALQDSKIVEIIQRFYSDLVKVLPLNDAGFRSELFTAGLLPGNLKSEIKSKSTQAEKVEHFLDYGIMNDSTNFHKLISVMEALNNDSVQKLAERMKAALLSLQTTQGLSVCVHMCVHFHLFFEIFFTYNCIS